MTSLIPLERYPAFAIDLDGVVWRGDELIDGAAEGLAAVRAANKQVLFLSNNSSYRPAWVAARLAGWGIEAQPSEVLTSAAVTKLWLAAEGLGGKRAFVLGSPALTEQLAGTVEIVEPSAGGSAGADVVVVARDTSFDFAKLVTVSDAVRAGARLVAVNRDDTMPMPGGLEPGTGAILAAIEVASGVAATVVGKPEMPMMSAALERLGPDALLIGDRVDSDVAGARKVGWDAALVLSGVSAASDLFDPAPDYVMESLAQVSSEVERYIP
jgi:glycerol-1-phosphatase